MPILLRVHRLRRETATETRRLLRVLLIRLCTLSTNSGRTCRRGPVGFLHELTIMAKNAVQYSRDWLSSLGANAVAWWIPKAAMIATLFAPPLARTTTWVIALAWMGTACLLNSRRCGRTHCRYTGHYYLAMILPVLVLASGVISVDWRGWLALAVLTIGGSLSIWWATERAWGKFS
jgi:hypothetical protein